MEDSFIREEFLYCEGVSLTMWEFFGHKGVPVAWRSSFKLLYYEGVLYREGIPLL